MHVCSSMCKPSDRASSQQRSHLHIREPHDFHMISYLESDIKQDGKGFLLE